MATAMLSAFTNRPIRREVAMTGEITLRGNVLPVGGIKEKVLAARRSGVRTLVLPEANRKNLEEIPRSLRRDVEFLFVSHVLDVFEVALASSPTRKAPAARAPRETPASETLLQPV
jgi:ATP-dependent Lon protease